MVDDPRQPAGAHARPNRSAPRATASVPLLAPAAAFCRELILSQTAKLISDGGSIRHGGSSRRQGLHRHGGRAGHRRRVPRALAAEGADVAIVDLKRIDQANEVQDDIVALGRRALTIKADVTSPDEMTAMAEQVVETLGRVDCLVNNAALMFDQLIATWDEFLAVNYMGILNASNGVIPYLWEQGSGSIVNISSTAAFPLPMPAQFMPTAESPPPVLTPPGYGVTKWMVIYQTRFMARLLGVKNIRVNAVAPGVTMSAGDQDRRAPGDHRHHHRVDRAALDARARGHDRRRGVPRVRRQLEDDGPDPDQRRRFLVQRLTAGPRPRSAAGRT